MTLEHRNAARHQPGASATPTAPGRRRQVAAQATEHAAAGDPATSFTPRPPTRWLHPGLLLRSAGQALVSGLLGQYNDKRELMGSLPVDAALDLRTGQQELWLDYVSDLGDGFEATYAIAHLLAQEQLRLQRPEAADLLTTRGRLLVMGGDQCYPSAQVQAYEDRLIGPYRAALPEVDEPDAPDLLAVPGNHDWYDGLTAFMRTFCQRRWIGGWRTQQSRSYFAVALPGRWWLWGIDIQFDTYIDDIQRRYFEQMAARLRPDDAVVLCSAKPSWVATADDDLEAYATLDFIDRTLIRPTGARLRVCLSGDRHHYARYEAVDGAQRITAGGGGAYLSPTHHLPATISVPPAASRARAKSAPVDYERRAVFPDAAQSRRLGWAVLQLPWTTPAFAALLGGVQTLLALAMVWSLTEQTPSLRVRLTSSVTDLTQAGPLGLVAALGDRLTGLVLAAVVVVAAITFTKQTTRLRGWLLGGMHGLLHLILSVLVLFGAGGLFSWISDAWVIAGVLPLVFLVGGFLATELVAGYLLVADRWRLNSNELYAAQAITGYKNFLRLHIGPEGDLTIYPVGLPRVPRKFKLESRTHGPAHFTAVGEPVRPVLIEPAIRVQPLPETTADETSQT